MMKRILALCLFTLAVEVHAASSMFIKSQNIVPETDTYGVSTTTYVPQSYSTDKVYPVIVFLNTNEFYEEDLNNDTSNTISRLMQYQTIPDSILITVTPKNSYQATVTSTERLTLFLADKLPKFINKTFQKHSKIILSGYSYGAGYILTQKQLIEPYSSLLSVSPVFDSLDAAKKMGSFSSKIETVIYFGDENSSIVNVLELTTPKKESYFRENLAFEDHQSVFQPALHLGLKRLLSVFAFPQFQASIDNNWSIEELKQVVENTAKLRGLTSEETKNKVDESNLLFAKSYTQQNKQLLALQYWQGVTNKHKWLHLSQSIEMLKQLHGEEVAISFIKAMLAHNLASSLLVFLLEENIDKAIYYEALTKALSNNKERFSESDLNFLGYHLMSKERSDLATLVFKEAVIYFPESLNLKDSLSDALIADCNITEAKQILNKASNSTLNERFKEHVKSKIQNLKQCD